MSEKRCQLFGLLGFILSGAFFSLSALRHGDMLAFIGSLLWIVACLIWLIPMVARGFADS